MTRDEHSSLVAALRWVLALAANERRARLQTGDVTAYAHWLIVEQTLQEKLRELEG